MDWSEKNLCIRCDEGGNLLVCSEDGCPLSVHEGCMGCSARFDDVGRFYCPYCSYKQSVAESRRAREYALARKNALLVFMDGGMKGAEKQPGENESAEANEHNQPKDSAEDVSMAICGESESRRKSDPIHDQSINLNDEDVTRDAEEEKIQESAGSEGREPSLEMQDNHKNSNAEENKIQEEEAPLTSTDQERSVEMQEDEKISNAEEKKIQEEEEEISSFSSDQEPLLEMHEDQKISNGEEKEPSLKNEEKVGDEEEENIQEEECKTPSASSDHDRELEVHGKDKGGSKRRKPKYKDVEDVLNQSKRVKERDKNKQTPPTRRSARSSSAAMKNEKARSKRPQELSPARRSARSSLAAMKNEKTDSPRRSKRPQESSVKANLTCGSSEKRKRLMWREEEEEMLREGVRKYAQVGNKNHPWRKILEDGQKVFDETRTPMDLKDKWRNMLGK